MFHRLNTSIQRRNNRLRVWHLLALGVLVGPFLVSGPTDATDLEPAPVARDAARDAAQDTTRTTAPPQATPKLVWTTMTSPAGHEVRVLRPEVPTEIEASTRPKAASRALEETAGALKNTSTAPLSPSAQDGMEPYFVDRSGRPTPVLSKISSFGVYGGFPSAFGFQTVIPTDATLAFRMGLTGFPAVGWLWTPGIEVRFGQEDGRFNTDGPYHFSNLYMGESSVGEDKEHWGAESGFGYRWILPDRRGVRWIAAIEAGGRWTKRSAAPKTPSIRAFWMIAGP